MTSDHNEPFIGGGSLDWDSERPMTVEDAVKLALEWRAEAERMQAEVEREVKRRYAPILTENENLRSEVEGWKRAHSEMTAARDAMKIALEIRDDFIAEAEHVLSAYGVSLKPKRPLSQMIHDLARKRHS